jgi:radical SAM-linked protein
MPGGKVWTQAIAEAGLTWKYRQVEQGEWNLFQTQTEETAPQNAQNALDGPLPWDHLDTGIDKDWLKADLQRALEATTVPDCSFDGCSHCGVCGIDFGHNVVVPPLPIPAFSGQFTPNQHREQRLRVWFGKQDDMALISHLDLVRLFDRAIRRAAIPIAFTGGFHPGPRIVPAHALPLGTTSAGEIVDFDLTESMDPDIFLQQLAAQLPTTLPLYRVEPIPVNAPSAAQLLRQAEYFLAIRPVEASVGIAQDGIAQDGIAQDQWQGWVDQLLAAPEIQVEQTTKSGRVQMVNLRERLQLLELVSGAAMPQALQSALVEPWVGLRYLGTCRSDGTLLRPEHVVKMLEIISQVELQVLRVHRQQLLLENKLHF